MWDLERHGSHAGQLALNDGPAAGDAAEPCCRTPETSERLREVENHSPAHAAVVDEPESPRPDQPRVLIDAALRRD
jgi:hypothetical protein